jgi:deoxyribose-phosphate aldolase
MSIAHFIDHTVLKQTATLDDIKKASSEAVEYGFAAVCIPPVYVKTAASQLEKTDIGIATVIGFPFGYHSIETKIAEARQAISDGANELDMVMNLAAFRNHDLTALENEIRAMTEIVKKNKIVLKVIIESGILSDEEIITCCEFYRNFDLDFLKTSTGYAEKGATVETVRLMRSHLPPHIRIKASGGIKTYEFAKALIDAGASRLGCSSSVAIIKGALPGNGY